VDKHLRTTGLQEQVSRSRAGRASSICALVAILILLVASCRFPGTVRPTVKIGLVAPFEGRYRYVGYDAIYAVRLALREANADGGLAGYGVELVPYDDGGDPDMAVEQAYKLDVDPQVMGVVGHFRDVTTEAAVDTYREVGLPLVVPTGFSGASTAGVRSLAPPADHLAAALLDRAGESAGDKSIVLLSDGGPLGRTLQERAGGQGLSLAAVLADADDWLAAVLADEPSVVLLDLQPLRAGEVTAALRAEGWVGTVMGGPPLAVSEYAAVAGASAAGAEFVTPWPFPQDLPDGDAFVAAYQEVSNGVPPGPLALPAYEGARFLLAGLERAADESAPSRDRVSSALSALQSTGPLGEVAPDEEVNGERALYWYRIGPQGAPGLLRTD
jgi:branched-chain amino acid transport system substrate-binding protein